MERKTTAAIAAMRRQNAKESAKLLSHINPDFAYFFAKAEKNPKKTFIDVVREVIQSGLTAIGCYEAASGCITPSGEMEERVMRYFVMIG